MCGIAGSIYFSFNTVQLQASLGHRGPDSYDAYRSESVELHHFRLSIQDIGGGAQPMQLGDLVIIFNGEIYNHQELRVKYNLCCITSSDTETILHLYKILGVSMLQEFDGMFAFAIYDKTNGELFLARDRAGKKPLYFYSDSQKFIFASEHNAIATQLDLSIDDKAVRQYFTLGYIPFERSIYQNMLRLPAGSYARVNTELLTIDIQKWWSAVDNYHLDNKVCFHEALEGVENRLGVAVKRRLISSDLEVGSFLSGGIDSGLVTAMAASQQTRLKTFTVSFSGTYDEAPLARKVAQRYNTDHTELSIDLSGLQNDVEGILSNYGTPFFDSSAIPSYYVSQAAKQYVTVVLNGDGGDELFGGYRRYVPHRYLDLFNGGGIATGLLSSIDRLLPSANDKHGRYSFLKRLTQMAGLKGVDQYTSSTLDVFNGFEDHFLFDHSVVSKDLEYRIAPILHSRLSGLKKIMNLDFDLLLESDLLVKMDIATMRHSLEGRSPLLGKELLEFVPGLNDSFKIHGTTTKYLLRELAKKYLPADVVSAPKRGFEIPLKNWIDGELKEVIGDYLFASNTSYSSFVDPAFIHLLWNNKIAIGAEKRAKILWLVFAFEVWHKRIYLTNANRIHA